MSLYRAILQDVVCIDEKRLECEQKIPVGVYVEPDITPGSSQFHARCGKSRRGDLTTAETPSANGAQLPPSCTNQVTPTCSPMSIGRVGVRVPDLQRSSQVYRQTSSSTGRCCMSFKKYQNNE